tara:strand:- start:32 stop:241 length:210 start_codon:yes stop_codon:yes gene_type:complete
LIIYKCNKDTEKYLTEKKPEYWSGKPTDPEHLNYTKNAFRDVFGIEPVFEKGYPSYEAVNRKENENETK